MNPANMTEHQERIAAFMKLADQDLPAKPTLPSPKIRELRARLILEEALETIEALGFCVEVELLQGQRMSNPIIIAHDRGPNLRDVADGCADISVVTIGTLLACGIADKPLLEEVDRSNLAKFELPKCSAHTEREMVHEGHGLYCCYALHRAGGPGAPDVGCGATAKGPYRRDDGKWMRGPDWKEPDIDGAILQSDEPATMKSWTPEQFDEAKEQLVAMQEFFAARELVVAIKRMRGEGEKVAESAAYPSHLVMQRESKTPHCHHCRGILSNKLVSNMIDRNVSLLCPNCLQPLSLISVIYA